METFRDIDENTVREKIKDLLSDISVLNEKMDFLYSLNQLDKSEIIYKLNLNRLVEQLEYYNAYMLKKVYEMFELRREIDSEKARESMGLTEDRIKDSLLSLFNGDGSKLMEWTQKNFPKFHDEVLKEMAKKQNEN